MSTAARRQQLLQMSVFAGILLAITLTASAQTSSPIVERHEGDDYTRYELLAPGSAQFKITEDVTATQPGARYFFNIIRKGSEASDEAVSPIDWYGDLRLRGEHRGLRSERGETRRRELAALPFERKLEIVLELQKHVAEIRRAAGRLGPEPWDRKCLRLIAPATERKPCMSPSALERRCRRCGGEIRLNRT